MCDAVSLRSRSLSPFTINISCAHTWNKLRFFSGHKFPSPCPARRAPPPRTHFFSCTAVALSHHRVPSLFKEVSSLLVCQTCLSHTNAKEARANAKEEEGRERETEEQYNNNSERQQWVWPRTFLFICGGATGAAGRRRSPPGRGSKIVVFHMVYGHVRSKIVKNRCFSYGFRTFPFQNR